MLTIKAHWCFGIGVVISQYTLKFRLGARVLLTGLWHFCAGSLSRSLSEVIFLTRQDAHLWMDGLLLPGGRLLAQGVTTVMPPASIFRLRDFLSRSDATRVNECNVHQMVHCFVLSQLNAST